MGWRIKQQDEFESRREVPWPIGHVLPEVDQDGDKRATPDPHGLMSVRRPETFVQALMETQPGDQPEPSVEEQGPLSELLADALDTLETEAPRHHWVFQAHVNRGLSYAEIGAELNVSKSHAHYLYQQAQQKLQQILGTENPDELR